jgi:ParB-like chromosome segregation protein Spo0J
MPIQGLFDAKNGGAFAINIRDISGDDSELRSSLKAFGWVEEFPAIEDENGVVLVGHRRLKIAREENIDPVVKKLTLGSGDAADAQRLKLALTSNIGGKPMTKMDRQHIAEHLYGEREWTMENIAKALNVAIGTVHKDLASFSPSEKPSRPKGGRPKGRGGSNKQRQQHRNSEITPAKEEAVAKAVLDEGKTLQQAVSDAGIGSVQIAKMAVAKELGRREVQAAYAQRISKPPANDVINDEEVIAALRRWKTDKTRQQLIDKAKKLCYALFGESATIMFDYLLHAAIKDAEAAGRVSTIKLGANR